MLCVVDWGGVQTGHRLMSRSIDIYSPRRQLLREIPDESLESGLARSDGRIVGQAGEAPDRRDGDDPAP